MSQESRSTDHMDNDFYTQHSMAYYLGKSCLFLIL